MSVIALQYLAVKLNKLTAEVETVATIKSETICCKLVTNYAMHYSLAASFFSSL